MRRRARYHRRYNRRGLSVRWNFWYSPRVYRYDPYYYYPRRYYRRGRAVSGFYVRIPSYRYYHPRRTSTYVFKQTVESTAGYAGGQRVSTVEVHTRIKEKVRRVYRDRVKIEFRIDRISLFEGGLFLGEVDRIPRSLGVMNVTIFNDGYVEYDRMSYLVGDAETGFEIVSTKAYGGHLLNEYRRGHSIRVGELDLYDQRVRGMKYSRFLDGGEFQGFVPVSLMPNDEYWGFQYMAGGHTQRDDYYLGAADYYDQYDAYDDDGFYQSRQSYYGSLSSGAQPRFEASSDYVPLTHSAATTFSNEGVVKYSLGAGFDVESKRVVEIQRLGGD